MQNLRSLACSVWAVGGVVWKSVRAFYIQRKSVWTVITHFQIAEQAYSQITEFPELAHTDRMIEGRQDDIQTHSQSQLLALLEMHSHWWTSDFSFYFFLRNTGLEQCQDGLDDYYNDDDKNNKNNNNININNNRTDHICRYDENHHVRVLMQLYCLLNC